MKIILSAQAETDLVSVHQYLVARNPAAAVVLAKTFRAKLKNLAHFPFIGRDRSRLGRGLRSIVAENYLIFYRVERDCVFIVRVLDGRRDVDAEFHR
jgi:toxin ParE1/3/4